MFKNYYLKINLAAITYLIGKDKNDVISDATLLVNKWNVAVQR